MMTLEVYHVNTFEYLKNKSTVFHLKDYCYYKIYDS